MVFTCVEIWRGIIITKEKLIELIKDVRYDYNIDTDEYSLYDIINDFLRLGIELPKGIHMFQYGPCHGNDDHVLLGIKLKEYKRTSFDERYLTCSKNFQPKHGWSTVKCCGKSICGFEETKEETKEKNEFICGEYVVCNECLNSTINGSYDVVTISSEVTECTTFCFYCNKDRCDGKKCDTSRNTTKKFIDELIESFTDCIGLDANIKNYYTVDDCLSCS